jgi:UTP-glucose-1-phosphate uridylyltransferase
MHTMRVDPTRLYERYLQNFVDLVRGTEIPFPLEAPLDAVKIHRAAKLSRQHGGRIYLAEVPSEGGGDGAAYVAKYAAAKRRGSKTMSKGDGRVIILAGGVSSRMRLPATGAARSIDPALLQQAEERSKGMIGVGTGGRPFLDFLLYNIQQAGLTEVVIVISEYDEMLRSYYGARDRGNEFHGLQISYAPQKIPAGRHKPLGTADALLQALLAQPDWEHGDFIVCNSDNLYSVKAFSLLLDCETSNSLIDYDRTGLEFDQQRIAQFGITRKDKDEYLIEIIEKPSLDQLEGLRGRDGSLRVSMNIFRLSYGMILPFLISCPEHPIRQERELVGAVTNMVGAHPRSLKALPLKEHVPDLTYKEDINSVQEYLKAHDAELSW